MLSVEGDSPLQREAPPPFPLVRGKGLFINLTNLTPFIPLSFDFEVEGEEQGRETIDHPGKSPRF